MTTRRRFLVRGSLLAMAASGIAVVLWAVATFHPSGYSFFPKCQFHALTGMHCLGCGLTRSLHAWLNGDVRQALAYHPLSWLVLPYIGWHVFVTLWRWAWGDRMIRPYRPVHPAIIWAFVIALLTFWVIRNIPYYPFTLLAPHELSPPG